VPAFKKTIFEKLKPSVSLFHSRHPLVYPSGFCRTENNFAAGRHLVGNRLKIAELGIVNIRIKLYVNTPYPDIVRQLQGKVASFLLGMPVAQGAVLAK